MLTLASFHMNRTHEMTLRGGIGLALNIWGNKFNYCCLKVYEGAQLMEHMDTVSGPALGLIISLYALISGSAHFAARASSLALRSPGRGARGFTSKHLFCGINLVFGTSMVLCMVLDICLR